MFRIDQVRAPGLSGFLAGPFQAAEMRGDPLLNSICVPYSLLGAMTHTLVLAGNSPSRLTTGNTQRLPKSVGPLTVSSLQLCGHQFQFRPIYSANAPSRLPWTELAWVLAQRGLAGLLLSGRV